MAIGHRGLAPDFELPDQHGAPVSLAELRRTGPVAVLFYPYAHTSICTSELRGVQQALTRFETHDVSVVAISCDSMFTLRVFADAEKFTFGLLSDFWPHGKVAAAYGVFDAERGCALRGTFLVDRDGAIRWSLVNQVPDERSLEDVFAALEAGRVPG